eukprot:1391769-Amorphochlora_amoeboformis.AAC.1
MHGKRYTGCFHVVGDTGAVGPSDDDSPDDTQTPRRPRPNDREQQPKTATSEDTKVTSHHQ